MNRTILLPILFFFLLAGCSKENNPVAIVTSDAWADAVKLTRVKQTYPSSGIFYQTDFRFEKANGETSLVATIVRNENGTRYFKEIVTHDQDGNTKEIKYSNNPNDTLNFNFVYKFFRNASGIIKVEHYIDNILTTIYSFSYPTAHQINYTAYSVNKYDTSYVEIKLKSSPKTYIIAAKNINKYPSSPSPEVSKYADTLEYGNGGITRMSYKATSSYLNSYFDTTIYSNRYTRSSINDSSVYKVLQFIKGKDGQLLPDFQNANLTYSFTRYHALGFLITIFGTPSIQPYVFSITPYETYTGFSYIKANGMQFTNPNNNIEMREFILTFLPNGRISKMTSAIPTPGFLPTYHEYFY